MAKAIPVPEYGPNTDYNSFTRYIELVNSGVPPFQALREAFPQGMMSPQERAKQLAKQEQSGALGQIAGMGVGLLGAKALQDALAGEKVLGGLREGLFGAEGTTGQGIGSRLADAFGFGGGSTPSVAAAPTAIDPLGGLAADAGVASSMGGGTILADGTVAPYTTGLPPQDPGLLGSINVDALAQGGLGALQAYQGYKQFQGGDKIGGGLGMAGGVANVGGALGSQTLGSVAAPLGAAYGAYTLGRMGLKGGDYTSADTKNLAMQGAAAGASIGSVVPGVGTAIGATIGAALGGITGLTGSKKGRQQLIRDKWRDAMLSNNAGLFGADYKGKLADGSTYDWGKEGKGRFKFDYNQPTTAKAASYGNVMAALQGATGKAGEAIATQFLGASTSNANNDLSKVQDNYKSFMGQLGIDPASAQGQLTKLRDEGKIDEQRYQVYTNDLRELTQPSVPPRQQQQRRR